jgi:hypothetical protein
MAEDARTGWIETEYEEGRNIPEPSHQEYSGKFNVRIPKSLHRALADAAAQDGVSLNQYVVMLLSSGNTYMQLERQLSKRLPYRLLGNPVEPRVQRNNWVQDPVAA